jgi:hypothetical protein
MQPTPDKSRFRRLRRGRPSVLLERHRPHRLAFPTAGPARRRLVRARARLAYGGRAQPLHLGDAQLGQLGGLRQRHPSTEDPVERLSDALLGQLDCLDRIVPVVLGLVRVRDRGVDARLAGLAVLVQLESPLPCPRQSRGTLGSADAL